MPERSRRGTGWVVIPCSAVPPVSTRTAASRTRLPRQALRPTPASCERAFIAGSCRSAGRRRRLRGGRLLAVVLAQPVPHRSSLRVLRRHLHQGVELRLRLGESALLGQGVGEVEAGLLAVWAQVHGDLQLLDPLANALAQEGR